MYMIVSSVTDATQIQLLRFNINLAGRSMDACSYYVITL